MARLAWSCGDSYITSEIQRYDTACIHPHASTTVMGTQRSSTQWRNDLRLLKAYCRLHNRETALSHEYSEWYSCSGPIHFHTQQGTDLHCVWKREREAREGEEALDLCHSVDTLLWHLWNIRMGGCSPWSPTALLFCYLCWRPGHSRLFQNTFLENDAFYYLPHRMFFFFLSLFFSCRPILLQQTLCRR